MRRRGERSRESKREREGLLVVRECGLVVALGSRVGLELDGASQSGSVNWRVSGVFGGGHSPSPRFGSLEIWHVIFREFEV